MLQDFGFLGALAGLALGLLEYLAMRWVLSRANPHGEAGRRDQVARQRKINLALALGSFVFMPVAGYFIGPIIMPIFLG